MELKGKVVVVTGAGSGMGAATARYLAKNGASVALLDVNLAQAEQVAKEIQGFAVRCDVSDETSILDALSQVQQRWDVPRVCVNCAGILSAARLVGRQGAFPLAEFQKTIAVNLVGTFNVMRLVAKAMSDLAPLEDNERGVIINTASVAAFEGQVGQVAYSASKGGVVAMTLPAARELAQFGIRVMTIAPGIIETPMFHQISPTVLKSLAAQVPFPKRLGLPEEFAKLVLGIVENSYLNGTVIRLDGALRLNT